MEPLVLYGAVLGLTIGLSMLAYELARNPVPPPPTLGLAGLKRARALGASPAFAALEPAMRVVAGWVGKLPLGRTRIRLEPLLASSGHYLGLRADELIALCALGAVTGLAAGIALSQVLKATEVLAVVIALLGAWIPYAATSGEAQTRRRRIDRELPSAIDLVALCMSAGLDFPGALRQIARDGMRAGPLDEELRLILQELDLGHPRRQALLSFGGRVASPAVSEFVSAVVQSEEKGNPLADVLVIQAGVLRQRRTLMAEEAAARAAVLIIVPLVLLILATLIVIAGPLLLRTTGGSMGGL